MNKKTILAHIAVAVTSFAAFGYLGYQAGLKIGLYFIIWQIG